MRWTLQSRVDYLVIVVCYVGPKREMDVSLEERAGINLFRWREMRRSEHMEVKIHHPNGGRENWRTIKACASPSKGVFAQQPKSQHKN